jgi:fatty acid desaturase
MLHYQADLRSLCFVALTLVLLGVGLFCDVGSLSIVLVPSFTFLAFVCCIITHNHTHFPIFKSKKINRVFDLFLALAKGHSVQTVVIPHNQNHHVFHGKDGDWITVNHGGKAVGWRRIIRYVFFSVTTMARQRRRVTAPKPSRMMMRSIREQKTLILCFILLALLLNPVGFALHIFIPWVIAMLTLVSVNLLQHEGCDLDSEVNLARNFTGSVGNWLLFNNGYHTVHHRYPSLHWSLLRAKHQVDIAAKAKPELQEKSLVSYLIRTCI